MGAGGNIGQQGTLLIACWLDSAKLVMTFESVVRDLEVLSRMTGRVWKAKQATVSIQVPNGAVSHYSPAPIFGRPSRNHCLLHGEGHCSSVGIRSPALATPLAFGLQLSLFKCASNHDNYPITQLLVRVSGRGTEEVALAADASLAFPRTSMTSRLRSQLCSHSRDSGNDADDSNRRCDGGSSGCDHLRRRLPSASTLGSRKSRGTA